MNKTVLITGASTGIGKASAEVFAAAGWNVAATSREPNKQVFKNSPNIKLYMLDVTDQASIDKAFGDVITDFKQVDVVVNNAGYGLDGVFESITDEQIQKQFDTNVQGLMRVTRAAIQTMRPGGGGTIIQISSMGGRVSFPLYSVYHASKWAVEGFSESLQYELRQFNIRIKIIEPGVIKTPFYGKSRTYVRPDSSLGYDNFVSKIESVSQNSGNNGEDPRTVARTILKAANDTSYKMRFAVGSPAPALLFLRRIVPEKFFYFLIRKSFKI
ncbi:SDR family oxidoreductase [Candidatus Saccharibacteria bacterium]|nr:SDR family oxidoreductase [Candidatus Saccharibacteria bacterium]